MAFYHLVVLWFHSTTVNIVWNWGETWHAFQNAFQKLRNMTSFAWDAQKLHHTVKVALFSTVQETLCNISPLSEEQKFLGHRFRLRDKLEDNTRRATGPVLFSKLAAWPLVVLCCLGSDDQIYDSNDKNTCGASRKWAVDCQNKTTDRPRNTHMNVENRPGPLCIHCMHRTHNVEKASMHSMLVGSNVTRHLVRFLAQVMTTFPKCVSSYTINMP